MQVDVLRRIHIGTVHIVLVEQYRLIVPSVKSVVLDFSVTATTFELTYSLVLTNSSIPHAILFGSMMVTLDFSLVITRRLEDPARVWTLW